MTLQFLAAGGAILAWLALTWFTLLRPRRAARRSALAQPGSDAGIAVIHASQTGTATELARQAAQALDGRAVLLSMEHLDLAQLGGYRTALFIVSTYGEGDPPDMAQAFHAGPMSGTGASSLEGARRDSATQDGSRRDGPELNDPGLEGLQVGVLALGDSGYRNYCGFGMALDQWLKDQGAQFLFETIRVDRGDQAALETWRGQLARHFQARIDTRRHYDAWRLGQRRLLNPGSQGGACHEILLAPETPASLPEWRAGDIAEIEVGASGPHRDYSIASTPAEGVLRLLVRQHVDAQGRPGLGSHWLTQQLQPGQPVRLRLRANPLFHAPPDDRPAIFVGNGTGMAGLRALLQERIQQGRHENWLLFGERQRDCDYHWREVLEPWLEGGALRRLDLAFSRDQAEKRYVHHLMRESAPQLRDWVARGAVIYICGSKDGMAQDVDAALRDILGRHGYEALAQRQGYRRDVY